MYAKEMAGIARGPEKKNLVIILIFIVLAVFLVGATHYGTKTLSAVRAYIAAEGKWTKAQKQATNLLLQYAMYGESEYYQKAQAHLDVNRSLRQTRHTLTSGQVDRNLATKEFKKAGIDAADIDLLIWLTVNFKHLDLKQKSLDIWAQADQKIARLDSVSGELHAAIQQDRFGSGARDAYIQEISSLDRELTALEHSFSANMAELARWIRNLIFWTITGTGSLLLIAGYLITSSYFRRINYLNRRLSRSEARLKKVLDHSRDVIYELDLQTGDYSYMSQCVENILGYSAGHIIKEGKQFIIDRTHPEDTRRLRKELKESEGKPDGDNFAGKIEYRIKTRAGNYIWVSNQRTLVRDENGVPRKIVGSGRDITQRKEHEQEMEKALQEKRTLLNEIHHRVKNNLAVISGLLELQKAEPADSLPSMIENTQNRIQSIATIHEKLYQSENLSDIDMREYFDEFSELLMHSYSLPGKTIEFKKELDSFYLDITQASPLGLMFNELLTNALEHGFPDPGEGTIALSLTKNNGTATLSVADNGKGLPENFDMDRMGSLGMTLVQTLARQLNANLEVSCDEWTTFSVTFPVYDRDSQKPQTTPAYS